MAKALDKNYVNNTNDVRHFSHDSFSDYILETLHHPVTKFEVQSNKKKGNIGPIEEINWPRKEERIEKLINKGQTG